MSVKFYIEYAINITNLHALMRYHLLKHSLLMSVNSFDHYKSLTEFLLSKLSELIFFL